MKRLLFGSLALLCGCGVSETIPLGDAPNAEEAGFSLSFGLNNSNRTPQDRVTYQLDQPSRLADVGASDFSIEFWMREGNPLQLPSDCASAGSWKQGAVIYDRGLVTSDGSPELGMSEFKTGLAFGVSAGDIRLEACGRVPVTGNQWHHIALTRSAADGRVALYVDGYLDIEQTGPLGDLSYPDGRPEVGEFDSVLALGARKGNESAGTGYDGLLDELRLSTTVRYTDSFQRPTAPFAVDAETAALFHFDEPKGPPVDAVDGVSTMQLHGTARVAGSPFQ